MLLVFTAIIRAQPWVAATIASQEVRELFGDIRIRAASEATGPAQRVGNNDTALP
jgi:hypothetical protein